VIEVDRDFRVLTWSPKCAELFGWLTDEAIGRIVTDIPMIHPEDTPLVT
jgi:PAS domain S-box-containing protein